MSSAAIEAFEEALAKRDERIRRDERRKIGKAILQGIKEGIEENPASRDHSTTAALTSLAEFLVS